ncbi:BnaCnng24130D [Brassica napus]|uniref:BnaCnng24130D protein n=1 Tax=Brassica napus TaxID=3708 RepID=A0A078IUH2_BRANA|nr:BnaCnng24130D [Brassica napus]
MVRREHYPLCVARSSTFKFPSGFVFPQNEAVVCPVRFRAVILDRCIKSLRGELQRLLLHLVQARSAIFPPLEHWSKILGHLLRHERTTAALLRSVPEIHSSSSLQASPLRSFTATKPPRRQCLHLRRLLRHGISRPSQLRSPSCSAPVMLVVASPSSELCSRFHEEKARTQQWCISSYLCIWSFVFRKFSN